MGWVIQGVTPTPEQAGSMEGFKSDTFLTDARSGKEALKCALPPKTRQQEGSPLNKVWLRVTSPLMRPFKRTTSSQMGGRSASSATLYASWRWSSESAATVPRGAMGEGEGREAPTPATTTPCSAAVKLWTAESDIPSDTNPGAGYAAVG